MSELLEADFADVPEVFDTPQKTLPPARPLSSLENHRRNDPDELLRHRFLCRKGTLLLCGPTGVGKSSFSLQCAVLWALGKPCMGITPARPLKSLIVQAENDDGDLAEMRDGVYAGLNLTAKEQEIAGSNIQIVREDERAGIAFLIQVVRPLLAEHRPDLLWIDPALSFLGGDTSSQKDVGAFLRNGLNPLLREFNCGCVIVHHTNKPPSGKEKPSWQAGDFAYLGSGSAEWANHARAVLAIRSVGSREVYELQAGKRGARLGWFET
ncbi:MAG: AAA family ATPase, partial [Verrucomicrobiota bacterium]